MSLFSTSFSIPVLLPNYDDILWPHVVYAPMQYFFMTMFQIFYPHPSDDSGVLKLNFRFFNYFDNSKMKASALNVATDAPLENLFDPYYNKFCIIKNRMT